MESETTMNLSWSLRSLFAAVFAASTLWTAASDAADPACATRCQQSGQCTRTAADCAKSSACNKQLTTADCAELDKVYYILTGENHVERCSMLGHETVLDALQHVGGFAANRSKQIWIARQPRELSVSEWMDRHPESFDDILEVNCDALAQGGNATNHTLMPGDRIFVLAQNQVQQCAAYENCPAAGQPCATASEKCVQSTEHCASADANSETSECPFAKTRAAAKQNGGCENRCELGKQRLVFGRTKKLQHGGTTEIVCEFDSLAGDSGSCHVSSSTSPHCTAAASTNCCRQGDNASCPEAQAAGKAGQCDQTARALACCAQASECPCSNKTACGQSCTTACKAQMAKCEQASAANCCQGNNCQDCKCSDCNCQKTDDTACEEPEHPALEIADKLDPGARGIHCPGLNMGACPTSDELNERRAQMVEAIRNLEECESALPAPEEIGSGLPMANPIQGLALRQSASALEHTAAGLEEAELYEEADRVRRLADELRHQSRVAAAQYRERISMSISPTN